MRLNSDTTALCHRATLNNSYAQANLEEWLGSLLSDKQPTQVLDLGCGQGKQIFWFAERWPNANFLGVDLSPEAVANVLSTASSNGLRNVTALEANLDDCVGLLQGQTFDAILSTYAIYYAKDRVGLAKRLASFLRPGGVCLLSGYAVGSNQEIADVVNRTAGRALMPQTTDFLDSGQILEIGRAFHSTTTFRLQNKVLFPSVESVMTWWQNHNSYRADIADKVAASIASIIERQNTFPLAKNVLAVRFDA